MRGRKVKYIYLDLGVNFLFFFSIKDRKKISFNENIKEKLRWLGHVLWMNEDRLPKIIHFGQPTGATWKAGRPRLGVRGFHK